MLLFWCPGCDMLHGVRVRRDALRPTEPVWWWNQDVLSPSLRPSVHIRWGGDKVCHFFVVEGDLQFLSDCTHHLAGKTAPMLDVEEWPA